MRAFVIGLIVMVLLAGPATAEQASPPADDILVETDVQGGLVVHVGCGDGRLITELAARNSFLVQGLDTGPANLERARAQIRAQGLSGRVSAMRFDGEHLPYIDNLVNLLVVDATNDIAVEEMMRVLTPRGVAYVKAEFFVPITH